LEERNNLIGQGSLQDNIIHKSIFVILEFKFLIAGKANEFLQKPRRRQDSYPAVRLYDWISFSGRQITFPVASTVILPKDFGHLNSTSTPSIRKIKEWRNRREQTIIIVILPRGKEGAIDIGDCNSIQHG
jgi:hypothetical protein